MSAPSKTDSDQQVGDVLSPAGDILISPASAEPIAAASPETPITVDPGTSEWLFEDEAAGDPAPLGAFDSGSSDEVLDLAQHDSTNSHNTAPTSSGFLVDLGISHLFEQWQPTRVGENGALET